MTRTITLIIAALGCLMQAAAAPRDSIPALPPDTTIVPIPCNERDVAVALIAARAAMPLNIDTAYMAEVSTPDSVAALTGLITMMTPPPKQEPISPYALPLSWTGESRNWKRLWINTGVLATAYVGTLLVLECLPEDATAWNRAEIQKTPPFKRWYENVFKKGPEIDGDNAVFNYLLHPYAGAVYFMGARSNGFNFYRSLLYSACISTIGWEFGIEAFMERPSIQDIFITPLVGSIIGEGFYRIKRIIVNNGYELAGSRFLGGFVAFLVDPLNEVVGLFAGNPARKVAAELRMQPALTPNYQGLSLVCTF